MFVVAFRIVPINVSERFTGNSSKEDNTKKVIVQQTSWLSPIDELNQSFDRQLVLNKRITVPPKLSTPTSTPPREPSWIVDLTNETLSQVLNAQMKYNQHLLNHWVEQCQRSLVVGDPTSVPCEKLLQSMEAYQDLFSRDALAVSQDLFNVQTYAVVLLDRGRYLGHIYAWQSPFDPKICLMMGIRKRPDAFLEPIAPVSQVLLEGVRRFALIQGCQQIIAVLPFPNTADLLFGWGFIEPEKPVPGEIIGSSIAQIDYTFDNDGMMVYSSCEDCLESDVDRPFTRTKISFVYVE